MDTNNHGGNEAVCEQVARDLKDEHGVVIGRRTHEQRGLHAGQQTA